MSKKLTNYQLENRGLTVVSDIVKSQANHDWQNFDQQNDDGVDGLIIYKRKDVKTGELFFAQVKCGQKNGYYKEFKEKYPDHFGVQLGATHIQNHRLRWMAVPGPMILIYVDYDSSMAWWTDLKDENSYSTTNKQIVLVPKKQRFGIHSFGEFRKLKGYTFISPNIPQIEIDVSDTNYLSLTDSISIKKQAKIFFTQWSKSSIAERSNPVIGEIIVSRVGWRHIIRKKRKKSRIFQSFQLLGIAKKMIKQLDKVWQVKVLKNEELEDGTNIITDFIGLRSRVKFSYRGSTVVQVLLKRKRIVNASKSLIKCETRFYSVYEPFAEKDI